MDNANKLIEGKGFWQENRIRHTGLVFGQPLLGIADVGDTRPQDGTAVDPALLLQ